MQAPATVRITKELSPFGTVRGTLEQQAARGHDMRTKVPPVRNANGYSKDQFTIDLAAGTVTCPRSCLEALKMPAVWETASPLFVFALKTPTWDTITFELPTWNKQPTSPL